MTGDNSIHITDKRINLEQATCPNREERANGINAYYGQASDLLKDAREGKLKQCDRKFQQTSGCTLNFYLTVRINTTGWRKCVVPFYEIGKTRFPVGWRRPQESDGSCRLKVRLSPIVSC